MKKRRFCYVSLLAALSSTMACSPLNDSLDGGDGQSFDGGSAVDGAATGGEACLLDAGFYATDASITADSRHQSSDASTGDWGSWSSDASCALDAGLWYNDAGLQEADAGDQEPDAGSPEDAGHWAWFQLSPDDSTSMASAQLAKSDVGFWNFRLKSHEVVNYYDPPQQLRNDSSLTTWVTAEGLVLAVDGETLGLSSDQRQEIELLVHVFAPGKASSQRLPWNLHLCIDVSGSMLSGNKIDYVKDGLSLLLDAMRPGDSISLTTFDSNGTLVFASKDFATHETDIRNTIADLEIGGSTNMIAGLSIAYTEAQAAYYPAATNRVLLFSDGEANVGDTDLESFAALTRINNQEGIYLSGVGVGSNYAMERMDALTDAGKGAHVFIPNADEVGVIFGPMVHKLIEVAADEVSIEVALPAGFALEQFSGEEVSTNRQRRVPNVVLATGDDMTMLSRFSTTEPDELAGDMILTVHYTPLATGVAETFEQQLPLPAVLGTPSRLLERTRLINQYGKLICGEETRTTRAQWQGLLAAYENPDPGLREISEILQRR